MIKFGHAYNLEIKCEIPIFSSDLIIPNFNLTDYEFEFNILNLTILVHQNSKRL